jgi:hypothetical protein
MGNVIAGTFALLDAESRSALLACAAFRGGFSIDLAERMLGPRALDLLQALLDASLVRAKPTAGGDARFDEFDTVRAFALEELAARPDQERALFVRHAREVCGVARGFRERAARTGGPAYLASLSLEHDNLTVALSRLLSLRTNDAETVEIALSIACELEPVRMLRGHLSTYVTWLEAGLRLAGETAPESGAETRVHAA